MSLSGFERNSVQHFAVGLIEHLVKSHQLELRQLEQDLHAETAALAKARVELAICRKLVLNSRQLSRRYHELMRENGLDDPHDGAV